MDMLLIENATEEQDIAHFAFQKDNI